MSKVKLLLGDFTFLTGNENHEYCAIINSIDEVIECDTEEQAEIQGEDGLENHESYLIPSMYGFKIENPNNLKY